jgi:hypothetical protein
LAYQHFGLSASQKTLFKSGDITKTISPVCDAILETELLNFLPAIKYGITEASCFCDRLFIIDKLLFIIPVENGPVLTLG